MATMGMALAALQLACLLVCVVDARRLAYVPRIVAGEAALEALAEASYPPVSQALNTPSNCSGWPEHRVYMEGQAWFTRPGDDIDTQSTHLHVGACMPQKQRMRGILVLHVLVQKHLFPNSKTEATGVTLQFEFKTRVGNNTEIKYTVKSSALKKFSAGRWTCNADKTLCKAVLPVMIKTAAGTAKAFVPDGWTRMTALATVGDLQDGKTKRSFQARITSQFAIDNFQTLTFTQFNSSIGVEQLANTIFPWGYTHAHITSNLPIAPINGTFIFSTKHFTAGSAAKTSNVTRVFISVDPQFHTTNVPDFQGKYILVDTATMDNTSANCPVKKGHVDCTFKDIELDTVGAQALPDGLHKLFIRTDSFVDPKSSILAKSKSNGGTFSAITLVALPVCNSDGDCGFSDPAPPDESPPVPPLPPIKPPPGTAWYTGSEQLPDQSQVVDTPYNCSGWLGPRYYLESQTWFTRPGAQVDAGSTQLRVGACLPHKQAIAGIIPVDILLQKQNFPSFANATVSVKLGFIWKDGNITFEITKSANVKTWACPNQAPACKTVYRALIDTRPPNGTYGVPDGLQRLELSASVKFDDSEDNRTISSRLESWFVLANNDPTNITGLSLTPNMTTKTSFPWKDSRAMLLTELPLDELAGTWAIKAKHVVSGHTGANVTGIFAAIDGVPGQQPGSQSLYDVPSDSNSNALQPSFPASPWASCTTGGGDGGPVTCQLVFDPTRAGLSCPSNPCNGGLCDGLHRLVLRTDSYVSPKDRMFDDLPKDGKVGAGTLSSVLVLPLTTNNGIKRADSCPAARAAGGASDGVPAAMVLADGGVGVDAANAAARSVSVPVELVINTEVKVISSFSDPEDPAWAE